MAEIKLFYHDEGRIKISRNMGILKKIPMSQFVWIDLNDVTEAVEEELEDFLKIYIQEEEEIEEIEISSRYIETPDTLVANSNFLLENFEKEPVSFILKNNILVSVRSCELRSFNETVKRIFANPVNYPTGYHIFVALLETRVERDADIIEELTGEISILSKSINDVDEDILMQIKNMLDKTMSIRENIIDKQRVVSNMLKSALFPNELKPRLSIVIKDINSLIEHTKFGFERLDYMQDTFLGLVNIQQNKIIKIFTVVSVIFMPPTLIASIYGMNFKHMPELEQAWGYPFSIVLMITACILILIYFRKKKWL
ncbi:magnesium/cobalt transporter CorA [Parabacteroides sp. FAFU027]|uniref:magnesium/cobalt transporter CorA n=1 Tax=Parabacteroides sp. FAFU027 TaxID=2922715 RepID=UPI001FAEF54E|nr:magnesium/cobalt transporter CorA [Parabacteroides sp. FAFU027]